MYGALPVGVLQCLFEWLLAKGKGGGRALNTLEETSSPAWTFRRFRRASQQELREVVVVEGSGGDGEKKYFIS